MIAICCIPIDSFEFRLVCDTFFHHATNLQVWPRLLAPLHNHDGADCRKHSRPIYQLVLRLFDSYLTPRIHLHVLQNIADVAYDCVLDASFHRYFPNSPASCNVRHFAREFPGMRRPTDSVNVEFSPGGGQEEAPSGLHI